MVGGSSPAQPDTIEPRPTESSSDVRAFPHELPQQPCTMILDHQDDRPLIEPEMPR